MNMSKSELYFKVGDLGFEKAWSARLAQNNPNMDNSIKIDLNDIIIRNEFLNKDIINNINTNNNKNDEIDQMFVFNLCFKRNLVKLNNELLDIINLNNYNL